MISSQVFILLIFICICMYTILKNYGLNSSFSATATAIKAHATAAAAATAAVFDSSSNFFCVVGEDGSSSTCTPSSSSLHASSSSLHAAADGIVPNRDVYVLGDVHGKLLPMKQVLAKIGIIDESRNLKDPCVWSKLLRDNAEREIWLVQVGDIVDRGEQALECWKCLENLQNTAPAHAKVYRMLGNHEIWWLEGHVHMAHPTADTPQNIKYIVDSIKRDVLIDKVSGSVYFSTAQGDVLLTHAGIQGDFLPYFEKKLTKRAGVGYKNDMYYQVVNAGTISSTINQAVKDSINQCSADGALCTFTDKVFKAGSDRGGTGFGGPFWSDFTSVLKSYNAGKLAKANFTQIVGHTAARCAKNDEYCIRNSEDGNIICVDGGLYMAAGGEEGKSFLKITHEGVFTSYEFDEMTQTWRWARQIKPPKT